MRSSRAVEMIRRREPGIREDDNKEENTMSEPLFGLMMDYPLTVTQIMRHAERVYPDGEVVSVTADNPQHRCT